MPAWQVLDSNVTYEYVDSNLYPGPYIHVPDHAELFVEGELKLGRPEPAHISTRGLQICN